MSVISSAVGDLGVNENGFDGRPRVFYFIDVESSEIAYQQEHVMRPLRVRLTHSLIHSLGLDRRLAKMCRHAPATAAEMCVFHREAYLECLRNAPRWCGHPLEVDSLAVQKEFDVPVGSRESDCPLFPQVWELAASQAGGSLACATALNTGLADIAIHWGGGMHHAAAAHASGFCFVNDIVLCIRRLLQSFMRVLYVDLDVHHGDGVEAAFIGNPRVMTLSIHQFGDHFFPGTGDFVLPPESGARESGGSTRRVLGNGGDGEKGRSPVAGSVASDADSDVLGGNDKKRPIILSSSSACSSSCGSAASAHGSPITPPSYAVNVPLPARSGDAAYCISFRAAFDAIMPIFDPDVVVVQCGADTISGDPIGRLCVTTRAHVACVRHILGPHHIHIPRRPPHGENENRYRSTHRNGNEELESARKMGGSPGTNSNAGVSEDPSLRRKRVRTPQTREDALSAMERGAGSHRRLPTVLLGGGGYHVLHTAQCWALHTATAIGLSPSELPLYIPRHDPYYMDYRQQHHSYGEWNGNRPTLHVQLDPDVDHPLPLDISLVYFRHLCRTLPWQLRAIRRLRQGFDRAVHQRITPISGITEKSGKGYVDKKKNNNKKMISR